MNNCRKVVKYGHYFLANDNERKRARASVCVELFIKNKIIHRHLLDINVA